MMSSTLPPRPIRAKDIMATRLVTLSPEMDVFAGVHLLFRHRISGAPVIDEQRRLLGVFTEKCCMKVLVDAAYDQLPGNHVRAFMIEDYVPVNEDTDLLHLAQLIWKTGERRFPVLQDGVLVGQVSRSDVLRAAQSLLQQPIEKENQKLLYLSALVEMSEAPLE